MADSDWRFDDEPSEQKELDRILDLFESEWGNRKSPDVVGAIRWAKKTLPSTVLDDAVAEFVKIDLEFRWDEQVQQVDGRIPQRPLIEDYVEHLDEWDSLSQVPDDLICHEFFVRRKSGDQNLSLQDYAKRFGRDLSDQLISKTKEIETLASPVAGNLVSTRCPECRESLRISSNNSLEAVKCRSCGCTFSLVNDSNYDRLDQFDIVERLGVGGFGTVWKARDTELDRIVALKIPRKSQLDNAEAELLLREARATAQLEHPHIVAVHQVSHDPESGVTYIVSDFIDGLPLADWASAQRPSFRAIAETCRTIADALDYAHSRGVIHRDLKPANILIDKQGRPHIVDFGLAKREFGEVTMTRDGQFLGTPAYAAPEQARGDAHKADRRTDVYALGVVMYELLVGERPFRGNLSNVLHQVLHAEPQSPRELNARIPKDLETICLRCLRKAPERRLQTAKEVADELDRHLTGREIHSRPISRVEKTWNWTRRKPALAGMMILLSFLAIAGPLTVISQRRLIKERNGRLFQSLISEAESAFGMKKRGYGNTIRGLLHEAEILPVVDRQLPRQRRLQLLADSDVAGTRISFREFLPKRDAPNDTASNQIVCLDFDTNGKKLVVGAYEGLIMVLDLERRTTLISQHIVSKRGQHGRPHVRLVSVLDDEIREMPRILSVLSDGSVNVSHWNGTGYVSRKTQQLEFEGIWFGQFSRDGEFVGFTNKYTDEDAVSVYETSTWNELARIPIPKTVVEQNGFALFSCDVSHDGQYLAANYKLEANCGLLVWDVKTKSIVDHRTGFGGTWPGGVRFEPGGRVLAFGHQRLERFLLPVKREGQDRSSHNQRLEVVSSDGDTEINCISFHPYSGVQATYFVSGRVQLQTASGTLVAEDNAVDLGGREVFAFDDHGNRFALSTGEAIHVWDTHIPNQTVWLAHSAAVESVTFSPNGRWLLSGGQDGNVQIFELERPHKKPHTLSMGGPVRNIQFDPNNELFVASVDATANDVDAKLIPVSATTWERVGTIPNPPHATDANLSGLGSIVYGVTWTRNRDGTLSLVAAGDSVTQWQVQTSPEFIASQPEYLDIASEPRYLCSGSDGRYLALLSGYSDPNVYVWDRWNGRLTLETPLPAYGNGAQSVQFASDDLVAFVGRSGSGNMAEPQLKHVTKDAPSRILDSAPEISSSILATSETGERVAALATSKRVVVFESNSGQELYHLPDEPVEISALSWSKDDKLAVGCVNGRVVVWDIRNINEQLRKVGLLEN